MDQIYDLIVEAESEQTASPSLEPLLSPQRVFILHLL